MADCRQECQQASAYNEQRNSVTLNLSQETEKLMSEKLSSGRFAGPEDLIQAALESFSENGPRDRADDPEKRAEAWLDWVNRHRDGPGLPDEAVRRDAFYD